MREVLWLLLAGCDSLAGEDYTGEPFITLTGTFVTTTTHPAKSTGTIALLWQDADGPTGPGKEVTHVPVTIEFPSAFTIPISVPPPDDVVFDFGDGGAAIAEAYVYVVDVVNGELTPLGVDRNHALVFADGPVADGSASAAYLGSGVDPGYHLRAYTATTEPPPAQEPLVARCVAGGGAPTMCAAQRSYQLSPVSDDDPLEISLTP